MYMASRNLFPTVASGQLLCDGKRTENPGLTIVLFNVVREWEGTPVAQKHGKQINGSQHPPLPPPRGGPLLPGFRSR
jgi:hypothetical protein